MNKNNVPYVDYEVSIGVKRGDVIWYKDMK